MTGLLNPAYPLDSNNERDGVISASPRLILSITCLFVLLRLAVRSRESEDHPGTWNLKSQASCAIDHFYLTNNVLYNHFIMHRLNFYGTQ
jgi:hypothetical protein